MCSLLLESQKQTYSPSAYFDDGHYLNTFLNTFF